MDKDKKGQTATPTAPQTAQASPAPASVQAPQHPPQPGGMMALLQSITGETDPARIEGALLALKDTETKYQTVQAENVKLRGQVQSAEQNTDRQEAERLVDEAIEAFKVAPAQRSSLLEMAGEKGEKLPTLRAFLEKAQPLIPAPVTQPGAVSQQSVQASNSPLPVVTLTAEEKRIAASCGLTEEEYAKTKAEQRRATA